jgi:hypothetical protein
MAGKGDVVEEPGVKEKLDIAERQWLWWRARAIRLAAKNGKGALNQTLMQAAVRLFTAPTAQEVKQELGLAREEAAKLLPEGDLVSLEKLGASFGGREVEL